MLSYYKNNQLFNHSLELGLRSLFIINGFNKPLSLNQIISFDYLILFTEDIGGPKNLHPEAPYRSTQLLIKRKAVRAGLNKMISKELLQVEMNKKGIFYTQTELLSPFLEHFRSEYTEKLKDRIRWITAKFELYTEIDLDKYINKNIENWGNEFVNEPLFRGVTINA